jgi:hypothetical protein
MMVVMAAVLVCLLAAPAAEAVDAADLPTMWSSAPEVTETNGPVQVTMTVYRRGVLLPPAVFHVYTRGGGAHPNVDFVPYDGVATLPANIGGTQSFTLTLTIIGDLYPEGDEYFGVTVEGDPSYPFAHVSGYDNKMPGMVLIHDTPDPAPPAGRDPGDDISPTQLLLSRNRSGGEPNARATQPVLSGDGRIARYAAYTSAATDIVAGSGSHRNVYLVKRGGVPGRLGTPWKYRSTALASRGRGGHAANGDSWSPALSGWAVIDAPRGGGCLAFVSRASNLVRGDANRRADVFLRKGRTLRRIAAPRGTNASAVTVAGDCRSIAMAAGHGLYTARTTGGWPRRVARGAISEPHLTYNGAAVSYARGGAVYTQRLRGRSRARRAGRGRRPTSDLGQAGHHPTGNIRAVAYERGGVVYEARIGGRSRRISRGSAPTMTAGGGETMFAFGPSVYMYATSNHFGERLPLGICPPGQGTVTDTATSARGNYVALACAGGAIYLAYVGPK